jgi:hypothetical protein
MAHTQRISIQQAFQGLGRKLTSMNSMEGHGKALAVTAQVVQITFQQKLNFQHS